MNANKELWEKGDFTRIAASMRDSGEALVKSLGITNGVDVLDLGSGDGTTALPAARLGAEVLGVDIASNLVEAGNRRAGGGRPRRTCGSRRATPATSTAWTTSRSTSWSASSARCSPRSRTTWPRRWCG